MRAKVITLWMLLFSFFRTAYSQDELAPLTVGIGTGFSHLFQTVYHPSLTTDTAHTLQLQKLPGDNFVISSVIIFRLGNLKVDTNNNLKGSKTVNGKTEKPTLWERLSINVAINLVDINAETISFNKTIDGGLGLGISLTRNIQLALFFDIARYRQLQDWVVENYNNSRIPNGNEYFNALDDKNNDLFYTKSIPGLSFKAIFSIGNKKEK